MAQYYSGKDVQQPYDTARESVKTLSDAASNRLKQARTSTGDFINRVKQTASDLVDPSRTVLPTPGSFLYQRDSDGNILYDEKGNPVTVRDYKRAGIEHFTQSQKDQRNPKSDAVNWFNAVLEDPSLSDQVRTPLLEASLGMQNAFELEDEDRLSFNESIKLAEEGTLDIPDMIPNEDLTQEPASQKTEPKKVDSTDEDDTSNEIEHPLSDPDYSPETTKAYRLEQQAAARQERLDRRDARVEAKKLEGFHAKRFKENLKNKPRTDIKDLFHKAK